MTKKNLFLFFIGFSWCVVFFIAPRPVFAKTGCFDGYTIATQDVYINNETTDNGDSFYVGNFSGKFCEAYFYFPFDDQPTNWVSAFISVDFYQYFGEINITASIINESWEWDETLKWDDKVNGTVIENLTVTHAGQYEINVTDYITTGGISLRLNASDNSQGYIRGYTRESDQIYSNPPRLIWSYYDDLFISVIQPHEDSVLDFGYQTIQWDSLLEGGHNYVTIELYDDDDFVETIVECTENDGEYEKWRIDASDDLNGTEYRIKITDYDEDDVYGWSDDFEIAITPEPEGDLVWMGMEWFISVIAITIAGIAIGIAVMVKISNRSKDEFGMKRKNDFDL